MKAKHILAAILMMTIQMVSCKSFTEHPETPSSGILFVDPLTLETEGFLDGINGGASICRTNANSLCVASSEGRLYLVDAVSMTLDTSFIIGGPQSSGYASMVYIAPKTSLYVIGSMNQLLEVRMPSGEVVDVLDYLDAPREIVSNDTGSFVYVSSPSTNRVFRVSTTSNLVQEYYDFVESPARITCGARSGKDTLLVSTNSPFSVAYVQPEGFPYSREVSLTPSLALIPSPQCYGYVYSLCTNAYGNSYMNVIDSLFPFSVQKSVLLSGTPRALCMGNNGLYLYALCIYPGEDEFILFSYNQDFETIVDSVTLPGSPVGMAAAGNRLAVLTY